MDKWLIFMQVTVILEHMFHPSEMEEEATLREDLEDDIKTECTKMGPVEKVRHLFGLHCITLSCAFTAGSCKCERQGWQLCTYMSIMEQLSCAR